MAQYGHVNLAKSATLTGTEQDIVLFRGTGHDVKVTNRHASLGLWAVVSAVYPDPITAGGDNVYFVPAGQSSILQARSIVSPFVRLLGDGVGGNSYTVEASWRSEPTSTATPVSLTPLDTYSYSVSSLVVNNDDSLDLSAPDLDTGSWSSELTPDELTLPEGVYLLYCSFHDYGESTGWTDVLVGAGLYTLQVPIRADGSLSGSVSADGHLERVEASANKNVRPPSALAIVME